MIHKSKYVDKLCYRARCPLFFIFLFFLFLFFSPFRSNHFSPPTNPTMRSIDPNGSVPHFSANLSPHACHQMCCCRRRYEHARGVELLVSSFTSQLRAGAVGKTSLLVANSTTSLTEGYVPAGSLFSCNSVAHIYEQCFIFFFFHCTVLIFTPGHVRHFPIRPHFIFPPPFPAVFDSFEMSIPVDSNTFDMVLWDTAGEEDHDRLRPLS